MTFPIEPTEPLPTWATDGGAVKVDPGTTKRAEGWAYAGPGLQYGEAPPFPWVNNELYNNGTWATYFKNALTYIKSGTFDGSVTAQTGFTAITGNIIASAGEISSIGNITSDNGDLNAPSGNVNANLIIASTALTVKNGNKLSLYNVAETASTSFKSHPTATQQDYILFSSYPTVKNNISVCDTSGNKSWGRATSALGQSISYPQIGYSDKIVVNNIALPSSGVFVAAVTLTMLPGKYRFFGSVCLDSTTGTNQILGLVVSVSTNSAVPGILGDNMMSISAGISTPFSSLSQSVQYEDTFTVNTVVYLNYKVFYGTIQSTLANFSLKFELIG